jgi:hypothetical protein
MRQMTGATKPATWHERSKQARVLFRLDSGKNVCGITDFFSFVKLVSLRADSRIPLRLTPAPSALPGVATSALGLSGNAGFRSF